MTLLRIARQLAEQNPQATNVARLSLPDLPQIIRIRPRGNQSIFAPLPGKPYSRSQVRNAVLTRCCVLLTRARHR
jgi:hypothetical protein